MARKEKPITKKNPLMDRLCKVEADRMLLLGIVRKLVNNMDPDSLPADYRSLLEECKSVINMLEVNDNIDQLEGIGYTGEDNNG